MVVIKNVAIVGATGELGTPVLQALIASKKFNLTVLSRSTQSTFPPSVKVNVVDYTSLLSLTTALHGQDAVVSTVGSPGLLGQKLVIDAAIAAGVKRFIPSEFGSNTANPLGRALPIFGHKVAVEDYLIEKSATNPSFTYTAIRNGPFLDWGLKVGFILNYRAEKTPIYDSGDQLFSTTSLSSISTAVVNVLTHFEETKNKGVYIEDLKISQNKLLELAKKVAPEKKWEIVKMDIKALKEGLDEKFAKGEGTMDLLFEYLKPGIFGEGYGAAFERVDNGLLGVEGKTEEYVEELWRGVLGGGGGK